MSKPDAPAFLPVSVQYCESESGATRRWYALVGIVGRRPTLGVSGNLPEGAASAIGATVFVKDELEAGGKGWAEHLRTDATLRAYRLMGGRMVSPKTGAGETRGTLPTFLDPTLAAGQTNLRRIVELGGQLARIADPAARLVGNGLPDLVLPRPDSADAAPLAAPDRDAMKAAARAARVAQAKNDAVTIEELASRVAGMLRDGIVPWKRSWATAGGPPRNVDSRPDRNGHFVRRYHGTNEILLGAGFGSPYWLSRRQIEARGGRIKTREQHGELREEPGYAVIWWNFGKKIDEKTGEERSQVFFGGHLVWNIEQTEGVELPPDEAATRFEFVPIEIAETLAAGYPGGPRILHDGGERAFYHPATDTIHLPLRERFANPADYYTTLFHELAHSTGHPSRLNRGGVAEFDHFGSGRYSREELVAEMTASILANRFGFEMQGEQSASYLANWSSYLESDPRAIVTAGSQARKAARMIFPAVEDDDAVDPGEEAMPERLAAIVENAFLDFAQVAPSLTPDSLAALRAALGDPGAVRYRRIQLARGSLERYVSPELLKAIRTQGTPERARVQAHLDARRTSGTMPTVVLREDIAGATALRERLIAEGTSPRVADELSRAARWRIASDPYAALAAAFGPGPGAIGGFAVVRETGEAAAA